MDITLPNHDFDVATLPLKLFELNRLQKKDIVKICCQPEMMNVQITKIVGEMCEGVLPDTSLFTTHGLEKGNTIRFQKKNIFAVVEKFIG